MVRSPFKQTRHWVPLFAFHYVPHHRLLSVSSSIAWNVIRRKKRRLTIQVISSKETERRLRRRKMILPNLLTVDAILLHRPGCTGVCVPLSPISLWRMMCGCEVDMTIDACLFYSAGEWWLLSRSPGRRFWSSSNWTRGGRSANDVSAVRKAGGISCGPQLTT